MTRNHFINSLFHKSWLLLLFYTVSFIAIRVGSALITYRTGMSIELGMLDADSAEDVSLLRALLLCVLLLLLITAWSVMDHWILSRKQESHVRFLCGAAKRDVLLWLLAQYTVLILLACAVTQLVCLILSRLGFFFSDALRRIDGTTVTAICGFVLISVVMGAVKYKAGLGRHWLAVRYAIFGIQMIVASFVLLIAGNIYMEYHAFSQHVEQISGTLMSIAYAEDAAPSFSGKDTSWSGYSYEQWEQFDRYIPEATGGNFYSFYAGEISLSDARELDSLGFFDPLDQNYYFEALYVTELFPSVFDWTCSEGTLFDKADHSAVGKTYIPVLIGSDLGRFYSVGDVIDGRYQVRGVLRKGAFYLNPRWEGRVYDLRRSFVLPMEYSAEEYGSGMFISNQLYVLDADQATLDALCEKVREIGLPEIGFRSMRDQLNYIRQDITLSLRFCVTAGVILLLLCFSSQTCMLLFLIELRKREYCIRMICGASPGRIDLYAAAPVFIVIVLSSLIPAFILKTPYLLFYAMPLSFIFTGIIMAGPFIRLHREPLIQSLRVT